MEARLPEDKLAKGREVAGGIPNKAESHSSGFTIVN